MKRSCYFSILASNHAVRLFLRFYGNSFPGSLQATFCSCLVPETYTTLYVALLGPEARALHVIGKQSATELFKNFVQDLAKLSRMAFKF